MAPASAFRLPDGECSLRKTTLRKTTPYLAKADILICLPVCEPIDECHVAARGWLPCAYLRAGRGFPGVRRLFKVLNKLQLVVSSLLAEADATSGGPYGESPHHERAQNLLQSGVVYRKVVIQIQLYTKLALELEWAHTFSKPKNIAKRKG
ncbi:hypothetical protein STEG23_034379 [Scotinomys teguina]